MTRRFLRPKCSPENIMMSIIICVFSLYVSNLALAQDAPPDIDCANPSADRVQPKTDTVVTGLAPVVPQPSRADMNPGLTVRYFFKTARNLKTIPPESSAQKGKAGKPILYLNHQFGRGEVFDSGTNRLVMMRMKGMLHLPQNGTYVFRALSNDGVRIYIGGRRIIDDPRWHSDRCSHRAEVEIAQAGWYEFKVEYFQRKGSAALRFYWQPPGADTLSIVPAEAYGHK